MCNSSSPPSLYMLTLPGSVSTETAHAVTNDLGAATFKVSTVLNSPSGCLLSPSMVFLWSAWVSCVTAVPQALALTPRCLLQP